MAAARHSTLDFMLGAKGEGAARHLHGLRGGGGSGSGGNGGATRFSPPSLAPSEAEATGPGSGARAAG